MSIYKIVPQDRYCLVKWKEEGNLNIWRYVMLPGTGVRRVFESRQEAVKYIQERYRIEKWDATLLSSLTTTTP